MPGPRRRLLAAAAAAFFLVQGCASDSVEVYRITPLRPVPGFEVDEFEWWHFDYAGWREYPILNVDFEGLP